MDLKVDYYRLFFRALANEERLSIIKLLHENREMCAQDVEKHFYMEQSTTSHHLNLLKKAGITKSRKLGRHIMYSLNTEIFGNAIKEFQTFFFSH